MAKAYKPDDYATRTFLISMGVIGAWIVAAFLFVILAD
jgi:hypothetical protein